MRATYFPALAASAVLALLLTPEPDRAQPPPAPKPPPDEFRSLVREVEEAYKAPQEVDKDVLKELRRQYESPTPDREAKIFREIRRLYNVTPDQERAILRELRRAYDRPSPEQEERIFREIRRNGRLPLGTVPPSLQADGAMRLFRRLDQDGDGVLVRAEMPEGLRGQWRKWDRNRDGVIDPNEYAAYYQASLSVVSDKVASGEIRLQSAKALASLVQPPVPAKPEPVAFAVRYGKLPPGLPDWFAELDTDRDGQVGLYEWRRAGRPIAEFRKMDLDGDGLLTPEEYLRYVRLAQSEQPRPVATEASAPDPAAKPPKPGKKGSPPAGAGGPDDPAGNKPAKPGKRGSPQGPSK